MKLSILICHLPRRKAFLDKLMEVINPQLTKDVEVLIHDSAGMKIGAKRNALLSLATGEYVCFVDDDDTISDNYVAHLMDGINNKVDCCSLMGVYTVDGILDGYFEHSITYKAYKTNERVVDGIKYERYPNHLNCIKASIAKQFKFPEKNHGEDTDWATQIHKSGLLKMEHYIPEILYYYDYRIKKRT